MNNLNLSPTNQLNLYGYDQNFIKMIDLYNNKKLPNKILFSGAKGIGKSTFSYHLINYILSKNENFKYDLDNKKINENNKSHLLLKNNTHPNFFIIDLLEGKKNIEISQVREMINFVNKSSFNNNERIILIDNAECLNISSINALLKTIEEPNKNVLFLLIFDSNKKIKDTLKSRCIKFNFFLNFKEKLEVTNKVIDNDIRSIISEEFINSYFTPGDYINLLNFSVENKINLTDHNLKTFINYLIVNSSYKKDIYIKNNIYKFIEFYFLNLLNLSKSKIKTINHFHYFVNKISETKKYNLDQESLFIEFKSNILNG